MPLEELVRILTSDMTSQESKLAIKLFTRLAWRVILMLFIAFAMGWFSYFGFSGFARADEVDRKIAAQMTPVTQQLAALVTQQKILVDSQKEQTAQSLRNQILDLQTKKCKAKVAETATLYRQLQDDAENKYYAIKGEFYKIPNCGDL